MTGSEAYYSVIQFCPDRFRAEALNVGVVLLSLHPHCIRARMTASHSRLKKVFGASESELQALKLAGTALEGRINGGADEIATAEDFRSFVATRANDLRPVEPRLVKVTEFQSELNRLFAQLVEPEAEMPYHFGGTRPPVDTGR